MTLNDQNHPRDDDNKGTTSDDGEYNSRTRSANRQPFLRQQETARKQTACLEPSISSASSPMASHAQNKAVNKLAGKKGRRNLGEIF